MPSAKNLELYNEIVEKLQKNQHFFVVEYKGLTVADITNLRRKLKEADSELKVIKNTLLEIALKNLEMPNIEEYLSGPNAIVYVKEDAVKAAKVLHDFSKENDKLVLKCGIVDGHVFEARRIKDLAMLPPKEELIAKLLGSLKSPLYGLVSVINGPVRGLAIALSEIAKQKEAQ